jgi:hypothetical protein
MSRHSQDIPSRGISSQVRLRPGSNLFSPAFSPFSQTPPPGNDSTKKYLHTILHGPTLYRPLLQMWNTHRNRVLLAWSGLLERRSAGTQPEDQGPRKPVRQVFLSLSGAIQADKLAFVLLSQFGLLLPSLDFRYIFSNFETMISATFRAVNRIRGRAW